jgi:hypothetical protein
MVGSTTSPDVLETTEICGSCRELNPETASLVTTPTALCRLVSSDGCRNKQNTAWPCHCINRVLCRTYTHHTFQCSLHHRSSCEPKQFAKCRVGGTNAWLNESRWSSAYACSQPLSRLSLYMCQKPKSVETSL